MYLHVGGDYAVRLSTMIGIFDLDNTTVSSITREYLNQAEKGGRVVYVSEELPKAFVVCEDRDKCSVYVTPISAATLFKRARLLGKRSGITNGTKSTFEL